MGSSACELPALGKTGAFTAACRAYESSKDRGRRLCDNTAKFFSGEAGRRYLDDYSKAFGVPLDDAVAGIVQRTVEIDNAVAAATEALGDDLQVVMLGCGGCTRSFRLRPVTGGSITVFEVDLPEVIAHRNHVFAVNNVAPQANVRVKRVGVDLNDDTWVDTLKGAGFSATRPSLWVLEGILKYFSHGSTLDALMHTLSRLIPCGSIITGDVVNSAHIAVSAKPWATFGGSQMLSGIDDPHAFFAAYSFATSKINQLDLTTTLHQNFSQVPVKWFTFTASKVPSDP